MNHLNNNNIHLLYVRLHCAFRTPFDVLYQSHQVER